MFDLNNDGKISMDELKRVLNASPKAEVSPKKSYMMNLTPSTLNQTPQAESKNEHEILEEIIKSVDKNGNN